ncbi:cytochrome c [Vibrio lentus]|uniref:Cytochrome C n=1 Tax=Vibrio lentus TaxID=136468 RepID=A0A2N7K5L7_9VIBR|nr:cytochrome c [Vibrio lentus]PMM69816.1 cytochrome C [Vibrio lentus]
MTMNSVTLVSLFLAPAMAVMLLSACSEEHSEFDTKTVPQMEVKVEEVETYTPNLVAGEKLAQNLCSQCHGDKIIPFVQSYPNIKGQKASYILKQLRDFKSDERQDLYMQSVVKSLSDRDLQDAAAFYSTLKPLDLYNRSKEYYHQ